MKGSLTHRCYHAGIRIDKAGGKIGSWSVSMPGTDPTKIIVAARVLPWLYPKVGIGTSECGLL